jgi:HAD superfamily hydrolase (TIGR01509 family)
MLALQWIYFMIDSTCKMPWRSLLTDICSCKAVVFDLFQTLIPIAPGLPLSELFCKVAHLQDGEGTVNWQGLYNLACVGRYPGAAEVIRETCRDIGVCPDESVLDTVVKQRAERHLYGFDNIDQDLVDYLDKLRSAGFKISLLSNSDSELVSLFWESPLNGLFDDVIFSHEVGLAKPDPAIFSLACARLQLPPSECLFVGDGANREFDGARSVGMKTALVMRYADSSRRSEWSGICDVVLDEIQDLSNYLCI